MNLNILRYLGSVGAFAMGGFVIFVLTEMINMPATTDFSKIMKPVDIVLFFAVASISIGLGIALLTGKFMTNDMITERLLD